MHDVTHKTQSMAAMPNDSRRHQHPKQMKTPETKAGRLTELIMARVRGKLPELPTHEYNRVYECVLGELNCHVLGETYEIPKPSAEPANAPLQPQERPKE